jgi:hypothetical protein|tara:strand:+ start:1692 stop:2375 length:684 start_codon:yes stop_codon:yes gene_type:complete
MSLIAGPSDWIKSSKSKRVWLEDSMTALAQFAYINPLYKVVHWDKKRGRRVKCWIEEGRRCFHCEKDLPSIKEYTYGVYTSPESDIHYMSTTLSTHTLFQIQFRKLLDEGKNPCDTVFEITRGKIEIVVGEPVNGYSLQVTDLDIFKSEKDRPSLFTEGKYLIPAEVVSALRPFDGHPINMIDLFLQIRELFPRIPEKDIKKYTIKLCENGVLDLRKAMESVENETK